MKQSKLLTLVLSSDKPSFQAIRLQGQIPTWITKARDEGFTVVPYVSSTGPENPTSRALGVFQGIEEVVNHTPAHLRRRVRSRPGFLSHRVNGHMREATLSFRDDFTLCDTLCEGLPFIGARTLRAFEFALNNFEFEYLARTNSSSYLDVRGLALHLPRESSSGVIHGLTGRWGRSTYPSGALYIMSRADVETVINNKERWIHEYIDDVALGLLAKEVFGQVSYIPVPRFDFPFLWSPQEPKAPPGFMHYRCKSTDPQTTIARMLSVHSEVAN